MSLSQLSAIDEQRLEEEITALGPWFHNLRLR